MIFAQGLGEYGMLAGQKGGSGGGSSTVGDIVQRVQEFVQNATPTQWAMIGGGLFCMWFVFLRRR